MNIIIQSIPVPSWLSTCWISTLCLRYTFITLSAPFPAAHIKAERPSMSGSSTTFLQDKKTSTVSYTKTKAKKKKLYKLILVRVTALDQNVHDFNDHGVISCSVKTLHWLFIREGYPSWLANSTYMVVILSCIMEWCGPIGVWDWVFSTILQQQCHHSRVTYQTCNQHEHIKQYISKLNLINLLSSSTKKFNRCFDLSITKRASIITIL